MTEILLVDAPGGPQHLLVDQWDGQPPEGAGYELQGDRYVFTGTRHVDTHGRRVWHAAKEARVADLCRWWMSLVRSTRAHLAANPWGPVPSDLISELVHAGHSPVGAYWPDTQAGPDGMYLAPDVQQWIHDYGREVGESSHGNDDDPSLDR